MVKKMLKIIKNIINKNCEHKDIICNLEQVSEYTSYEYQYCMKCHKKRKIIHSLGCRVEMEWK